MSDKLYYILSLNHSRRDHRVITWWGPSDCGHVFRLEWAGKYTAAQVEGRPHYYNGYCTRAVPCDEADARAVLVGDVESRHLDREKSATDRVVPIRHLRALSGVTIQELERRNGR